MAMVEVIFDSSFLMLASSRPLKQFDEMLESLGRTDLVVLLCVLDELKTISSRSSPKRAKQARLALEYAKNFKIINSSRDQDTDTEILKYAYLSKGIVATMDKNLIKKLNEKGLKVITCRQNRVVLIE